MKNLFSLFTLSMLCAIPALAQTVVVGNQSVPTDIAFDDNGFIVPDGAELYFETGAYNFNPGRGIEVMTGGYLQFSDPNVVLSSSSGYWAGITVYASDVAYDPTNLHEDNWGFTTKHNYTISRAKTGIFMRKEMATYNFSTSTVNVGANGFARSILSYNGNATCEFLNNQIYDIRIHNQTIEENHSSSGGSSPVWKNYYFNSNSPDFNISIEVRNTNMMAPWENFSIQSPFHGIYLGNSNANIYNSQIITPNQNSNGLVHRISTNNVIASSLKNSTIRASNYGVYTRRSKAMYIGNNTISSQNHDIYAHETKNLIVFYNTLNFAKYGIELLSGVTTRIEQNVCVDNPGIGIYASDCEDTRIAENNVGWNNPALVSDEGISIANCSDTRIIRNRYKRATRQLQIYGTNPDIRIACNTFEDPTAAIDAAITISGTPINNQGDIIAGANNWFNQLPAAIVRVRNTTGTPLEFYNTIALPLGPNNPSVNTLFFATPLFPAFCNIPKLAQDTDIETEVETEDLTPTPNPFTNYLTIGEDVASIQIYSISGQMVENIKTESSEVNLEHLNSGTYFIVLNQTNGNTSRHKIVKQ